jgi:hypothetical protein
MKASILFGHELLAMCGDHARRILVEEKHRELTTIYHLIVPEGPHPIVPCPWRNDTEKEVYLAALRHIAHEKHATAFACVSEVWMTQYAPGELEPGAAFPRPSQSDRKVEAVFALYHDGVDTLTKRWLIERGPDGYVSDLVEQPATEGTFRGLLMDDILP